MTEGPPVSPEQGYLAVNPLRQLILGVMTAQQFPAGRLGEFRLVGTGTLEKGKHDELSSAILACWLTLVEMLRLLGVITALTEGRLRKHSAPQGPDGISSSWPSLPGSLRLASTMGSLWRLQSYMKHRLHSSDLKLCSALSLETAPASIPSMLATRLLPVFSSWIFRHLLINSSTLP